LTPRHSSLHAVAAIVKEEEKEEEDVYLAQKQQKSVTEH